MRRTVDWTEVVAGQEFALDADMAFRRDPMMDEIGHEQTEVIRLKMPETLGGHGDDDWFEWRIDDLPPTMISSNDCAGGVVRLKHWLRTHSRHKFGGARI